MLLAVAVPGLSQRVSDQVLGNLGSFYGALSVADCIAVLDPKAPSDWLRHRKLFREGGALRKAGLIVLEPPTCAPGPDSLTSQSVRLSMAAFAAITGDDKALTKIVTPEGT